MINDIQHKQLFGIHKNYLEFNKDRANSALSFL